MKTLFFVLVMLAGSLAYGQSWQWAVAGVDDHISLPYDTRGSSIIIDGTGNIYVVGVFYGTMTLDTATLTSAGGDDIFLAKYNSRHQLLWAHTAGSAGDDEATAVSIDDAGNIYTAGSFVDTAHFDSVVLQSAGGNDIFIAKYTPAGSLIWAKNEGTGLYDEHLGFHKGGMKTDHAGHIYLSGRFGEMAHTTAQFGNITLTATNGSYAMFIARYDTAGTALWAKQYGGYDGGDPFDLAIDDSENVYITGDFNSSDIYFDSLHLMSFNNAAPADMFLVKYDSSGKIKWAKSAGGDGTTSGGTIVIDSRKNIYLAGGVSSSSTHFPPRSIGGVLNISTGFIAKYDASGNVLSVKKAGFSAGENDINGMLLDNVDNIYTVGMFDGYDVNKGDTTYSYGSQDICVVKYDSNINEQWFAHAGGPGTDWGYDITLGPSGQLYTTGFFSGYAGTFGSYSVAGTGTNAFIAEFSPNIKEAVPAVNKTGIKVFPNPANNSITISTGNGAFTTLRITDCIGRQVFAAPVNQAAMQVNTAAFANGLYFITLCGANGTVSDKLIVEH